MISAGLLKPGNVVVVRSDTWTGKLIEIGSILRGLPSASHVALVDHVDKTGTLWGIEGRPGGVGWVDMANYTRQSASISNWEQPLTDVQRALIMKVVRAMIGTPYDWQAILDDTDEAVIEQFGLRNTWSEKVNGALPGHIVCSSLATYGYVRAGAKAPMPSDYRHVFPADWTEFIDTKGWLH